MKHEGMVNMFFKKYLRNNDTHVKEVDGKKVLTKTTDFMLYVIRKTTNDEIVGTVLLSEAQAEILNTSCNEHGIKFVRNLSCSK